MIDIVSAVNGQDLVVDDTLVSKAANILSIQVGALEYQPDFGIDLKFFLDEQFEFQNESFRSYLVQVLSNNGINVGTINEVVRNLFSDLNIEITDQQRSSALIAR